MDVEVVKSVAAGPGNKENSSSLPKEENGVVHQVNGIGGPIKFGSHGVDEPKESGLETNFPRDAVDDWPAPQQIHSFYFVKYRPYEDPKLKEDLEKAETALRTKSAVRSQIYEKLRAKKSERAELIAQVKPLHEERRQMNDILEVKTKEMQPLREALSGKMWSTNGGPKEKGAALCSSEEELNGIIKGLEYRLQHETIPLKLEKQILREINQLESTRGKVAANAAMRMKIQDSMGGKDAIQDQVKLVGVDMDGVREDRRAVNTKIKPLDEECVALKKEVEGLMEQLKVANENREVANKAREELWKKRETGNASYYKNRTILNRAKELAANKDIEAVKELEKLEVEKFMSDWTSNKAVRDDYEKRLLSSLDFRQLSRDGRIRNPDEKPLVPPPQAAPAFTSTAAAAKTNVKQAKENHVSSSPRSLQVEDKAIPTKESKKKETGSATGDLEEEVFSGSDKLHSQPKQKEVDEAKLKEMKREEELAKAKQALERKKKLAEKAAAKAAIKAQKEAEKKLKEREKKSKKKAGASGSLPEPEERPADEEAEATVEPEKVEEDIKPPVPSKTKSRKENTARLRTKPRGPEALPRAILKRKRSANYWAWAVPAAAVAAGLVVLAVGYTYFI